MQHVTPALLKRYFKGQCTAEEKALVEQWLSSGVGDAPEEHSTFTGVDREVLKDQLWQQVQPVLQGKRQLPYPLMLKVAASLLFIISAGWFVSRHWFGLNTPVQPLLADYKVVKAERGKKVRLRLADGTIVHLNAGSELSMPEEFADTARTILLTGEAYLEVAKDPSRPFTVITHGTFVRVLGTVFNVRAYPEEDMTTITVEEGKVRVSDDAGHYTLLTSNQTATYSLQHKTLLTQNVQSGNYTAWCTGTLIFNNEPLSAIAPTLERWYDVDVEIRNKTLSAYRFTGRYKSPALSVLVRDMSTVMKFNYTLDEKHLIIY